ncbi:MAG: hypothetical protein CMM87_02670 [Rickettsiales bacterium]|nr:hypothetical protein [Rickettsiales bacterium]
MRDCQVGSFFQNDRFYGFGSIAMMGEVMPPAIFIISNKYANLNKKWFCNALDVLSIAFN